MNQPFDRSSDLRRALENAIGAQDAITVVNTIRQWGADPEASIEQLAGKLSAAATIVDQPAEQSTLEKVNKNLGDLTRVNATQIPATRLDSKADADQPTMVLATPDQNSASAVPPTGLELNQPTSVPLGTVEESAACRAEVGNTGAGENKSMLRSDSLHRLHAAHAEGGLGVVWLATDQQLQRAVAVKEIKGAFSSHREACDRFLFEAQVTARLEHPGIVPVYHLGTNAQGRPFYSMRFINGQTLDDAIGHLHRNRTQLTSPLWNDRLRTLLRRFIGASQAIGYAHSRGFLHRDIKPANIMLGDYGETLVVDWGLAKRFDAKDQPTSASETRELNPASARLDLDANLTVPELSPESQTVQGKIAGTPGFMSPEQIQGHLDQLGPRSDVYSLGCTLYQLLTGVAPFRGCESLEELKERIVHGKYRNPRLVLPSVPKPLEAICCQAMHPDPKQRYQTVDGLINDLESWLDDRPVSAHRDSWMIKIGRWLRRHRSIATTIAIGLLTTLIAALYGLWAVEGQRQLTADALDKEQQARQITRASLDSVTDGVVGQLLAQQSELTESDRQFLHQVIEQLDAFAQLEGDSPAAAEYRAEGLLRVANLRQQLGEFDAAESNYRQTIELIDSLDSERSSRLLAQANNNLGRLLANKGEYRSALQHYQAGEEAYYHLKSSGRLTDEDQVELFSIVNNQGNMHWRLGESSEAMKRIGQAIDGLQQIQTQTPVAVIPLVQTQANYGSLLKSDGQLERAIAHYNKALERWETLRQTDTKTSFFKTPQQRMVGTFVRTELATALLSQKQYQEAVNQLKQAVDDQQQLVDRFPSLTAYRRQLARSQMQLGKCLAALKSNAAETFLSQAESGFSELAERFPAQQVFHVDYANALETLAQIPANRVQKRSQDLLLEALGIRERMAESNPDDPELKAAVDAVSLSLANQLRLAEQYTQAEQRYRAILRSIDQGFDDSQQPLGSQIAELKHKSQIGLADCLSKTEQYEDALVHWQALAKLDEHPEWKVYELQRIICLLRLGRVDDATKSIDEFLEITEQAGKSLSATDHYDLACCYAIAFAKTRGPKKQQSWLDLAVQRLRKAQAAGFFDQAKFRRAFHSDPDLDAIRDQRQFLTLLKELNLPTESPPK